MPVRGGIRLMDGQRYELVFNSQPNYTIFIKKTYLPDNDGGRCRAFCISRMGDCVEKYSPKAI